MKTGDDETPFRPDPERTRVMIESAFAADEGQRELVTHTFHRALGDLTLVCMEHGDMCDHHVVALRDAIMRRAGALATRVATGVRLYMESRDYGIQEPLDLAERLYQDWEELAVLFGCREPHTRIEINIVDAPKAEEDEA